MPGQQCPACQPCKRVLVTQGEQAHVRLVCCDAGGCPLSQSTPNLDIIVFTTLGSEVGLICKQPLRPVTTPQCCEAVSPNPINKAFTYNGLHRFHTVDLSPQFRKGNFGLDHRV